MGTGSVNESTDRLQELIKPDRTTNDQVGVAGAIRDANADFLSEP